MKVKSKPAIIIALSMIVLLIMGFLLGSRIADSAIDRPVVFGATYMTMNNPYFSSLNESIREVVESHGDVLLTRDPAQDQERQNREIHEMIDEGMTVLFANAADSDKISSALEECKERGVAVFVVDTEVKDTTNVISTIQSDQFEAGRLVAKDMKKRCPEGARIVALYHETIQSTEDRLLGFEAEIKNDDRYKIVMKIGNTSEIEVANREMNLLLKNFRDFDVVFGNNDPSALGALAALDRYNMIDKGIMVYGIDGSPDAKRMILDGKMQGTAAQYPILMGKTAAETAYAYLNGENVQKNIYIKVSMMNSENLNENNARGWQ
ncbi:sugar ABC transporter substrate-binding protein [Lachnospiraceae bacterium C1.1]|nr:sugar ABC transporter substrate-binding protein [Lachnospiraceae bacterium C1.1]